MIGSLVGSYRITQKVSVGGMGVVYRAEHTLIGKPAAVKVLHPELSGNQDLIQRFFNEAKATTAIDHPGIVSIFDYGYMKSGHAYIIMEFLEGMSLARRIKTRGRMAEGDAAMLLRSLCSALAAAHAKGIVHRDLKPDNIYLIPDSDSPTGERAKILDFGIAKLTEPGLAGTATKTGAVMGTPTYMSPEQCRGTGDVDLRADLYALGCIYYELVAGQPPFTAKGGGELIGAHLYLEPQPPSKHGPVSGESEALIMSLLQKDPANRPQTARELAQRLTEIAKFLGVTAASALPSMLVTVPLEQDVIATRQESPVYVRTTEPPSPEPALTMTPESAEKPTTLRGAAGESSIHDVPQRSRKWIVAVAGMAVVAVGLGVAFMVRGSGDDAKPARPAANAPDGAKPEGAKPDSANVGAKPDSAKPDSAKPDSANVGAKPDSANTAASKTDSANTDSAKTGTPNADSAKTDSAKTGTANVDASKTDGTNTDAKSANTGRANTDNDAPKANTVKASAVRTDATKTTAKGTPAAAKPDATKTAAKTTTHTNHATPPPKVDTPKPPPDKKDPPKNPLIETDL